MPGKQLQESLPKGSWIRQRLTLVAITVLKRFRPRSSSVLFLTRRSCVKYGPFEHLSDAAAMQFIASRTSIPVPKVYCAFERRGTTYVVMSRIPGTPIGHEWEQRSGESKDRLMRQLKAYMDELRSLEPPNKGAIEGVDNSKLFDVRLPRGHLGFGPFESVRSFHEYLREGIGAALEQTQELNDLVENHERIQFSTCFTHGDLNSMNILVKGDTITGIVDWDTAGWYPEYWEYTSAKSVNPYNQFWKTEIGNFLEEYPQALEMEQLRQKYFGAF